VLKLFKILFILLLSTSLNAQIPIEFKNPSFEGKPTVGSVKVDTYLKEWIDCGHLEFPDESSFDIQPGFFEVEIKTLEGESFVGLVTRENGSYESLCQELDVYLIQDSIYQFSIYLAKSEEYKSITPASIKASNDQPYRNGKNEIELMSFAGNTILRVWGGTNKCSKEVLLFNSEEIDHDEWRQYDIEFIAPSNDIKFLSFEAYYPDDSIFTRGNLMIDYIVSSRKE